VNDNDVDIRELALMISFIVKVTQRINALKIVHFFL